MGRLSDFMAKYFAFKRLSLFYLAAINLHDQRPPALSACSISRSLRGHVAVDIDNFIVHNQWVGFALI